MKSVDDLKKIRAEVKKYMNLREVKNGYKVVVSMGTCGIAHGAKDILNVIAEEVYNQSLNDVLVVSEGCVGECDLEPIVEVYDTKNNKYTYCKVDKEGAKKIVNDHVKNNKVVTNMLIENHKN